MGQKEPPTPPRTGSFCAGPPKGECRLKRLQNFAIPVFVEAPLGQKKKTRHSLRLWQPRSAPTGTAGASLFDKFCSTSYEKMSRNSEPNPGVFTQQGCLRPPSLSSAPKCSQDSGAFVEAGAFRILRAVSSKVPQNQDSREYDRYPSSPLPEMSLLPPPSVPPTEHGSNIGDQRVTRVCQAPPVFTDF